MLSVFVMHGRSGSRARSAAWFTRVLGHVPIGGPLAAGRGEQAGGVDVDRVIARERGGELAVAALDQRTDADEHASTSARVGALCRYWPAVSRMNAISSSSALRLERRPSIGVSVVPTSVWPCHGMANITRPSRVWGTMIALSPGRNACGRRRCACPGSARSAGDASGSSSRRTPSAKGPVALMTTLPPTRNSRPALGIARRPRRPRSHRRPW